MEKKRAYNFRSRLNFIVFVFDNFPTWRSFKLMLNLSDRFRYTSNNTQSNHLGENISFRILRILSQNQYFIYSYESKNSSALFRSIKRISHFSLIELNSYKSLIRMKFYFILYPILFYSSSLIYTYDTSRTCSVLVGNSSLFLYFRVCLNNVCCCVGFLRVLLAVSSNSTHMNI